MNCATFMYIGTILGLNRQIGHLHTFSSSDISFLVPLVVVFLGELVREDSPAKIML